VSRKHNTKHARRRSRYPERLARRGVTNVDVRMSSVPELRRRAERHTGAVINLPIDGFDYDEVAS